MAVLVQAVVTCVQMAADIRMHSINEQGLGRSGTNHVAEARRVQMTPVSGQGWL